MKRKGLPEIRVTDDYDALVGFFIENGLEFSVNDEVPQDLIKCWDAHMDGASLDGAPGPAGPVAPQGEAAGGLLVGGCVLALREGEYIIDGIAVDARLRHMGLGESLLGAALQEIRDLGGKRLFLVARAPDFFRKQGFATVGRDAAPNFFECFSCPQYNLSCFPEVMRLDIKI
ncbi:MAG: GNAT family N-acetyltransferase [Clostridiales Family XIII bacterium]|nr:GNAT family N-acetyltransferase [Clostridiales Family XIII bacterium]